MTPEEERARDRAVRTGIRQRMGSPKPRSGWALVVLAVMGVVVFGLAVWVSVPWPITPARPSDLEAVHALAQDYAARHPAVRGPPEDYRAEARALEHTAPRTAAERLTRALALDPDDAEAWLHLVVLSSRSQAVQELGPVQAQAVADAVAKTRPNARLLPAAQAWVALQANAPMDALARLGAATPHEPVDARWARLRATLETGGDLAGAAAHLLSAARGHPEACERASQAALAAGDWFAAEQQADACLQAGVESSAVRRARGQVAWLVGDAALAAVQWERAGLWLHAAAAHAARGAPDEAMRLWSTALDGPLIPPVAVRGVWLGLQTGDRALVEEARMVLAESGLNDPTVRHAWAAAELSLDNPGVARGVLEGLTDPMALFLRAQATQAPADAEAAFLSNPSEPAVAALAARILGDESWVLLAARDPLEVELRRRLPSIDEPWQVFAQDIPETPAWLALVGRGGPPPDEDTPLAWWAASQRSVERCPRTVTPSALAWCLRRGTASPSPRLVTQVAQGTTFREIVDTIGLPDEEADASLARILAEQPVLAGLARERYDRRVRAKERTPTP